MTERRQTCHGEGVLYRQDSGACGLTTPCPDCDDYGPPDYEQYEVMS